jgi:hypothetical protein
MIAMALIKPKGLSGAIRSFRQRVGRSAGRAFTKLHRHQEGVVLSPSRFSAHGSALMIGQRNLVGIYVAALSQKSRSAADFPNLVHCKFVSAIARRKNYMNLYSFRHAARLSVASHFRFRKKKHAIAHSDSSKKPAQGHRRRFHDSANGFGSRIAPAWR